MTLSMQNLPFDLLFTAFQYLTPAEITRLGQAIDFNLMLFGRSIMLTAT
jgi:hypothetical protein